VELYSHFENYDILSFEDTHIVKNELSPLILPNNDDVSAVRFDALMYGIELAYLDKKEYLGARQDLIKKINGLARLSTISEIREKKQFINTILNTDYLLNAGIYEFEKIRIEFRDLMKYLPTDITYYDTNLDDNILSTDWYESQLENDDLKNYKMKVEFYIQKHQDNEIINKLKTNQPLSKQDMQLLEDILWKQLGSKDDYYNEFGDTSIGEFIRSVVGLDMNATKKAFSDFLNDSHLNSEQIYFVNQIIEYIVHNGVMMDWKVLKESPFTDRGSVGELFPDSSLLY
ncbi:restriction endonuclease subunit R, partial [Coprobacillus cateniformis]|nr:restriction endonuclease subunit R [Coprobacillus cateniformis]